MLYLTASILAPNNQATESTATGGFKLVTLQTSVASPPTEECEGSHTQEEHYRLWQGATKKKKR